MTEKVFDMQLKRGDDALAEAAVASASFKEGPLNRILNHPEVYAVVSSGRMQPSGSSRLAAVKPTLWMSTSVEVCEEIALRCGAVDAHTSKSGSSVAAAVCKGFLKTLKRKDPGRIRRMLRQVAARIRHSKQRELIQDLRWNEKNVAKA